MDKKIKANLYWPSVIERAWSYKHESKYIDFTNEKVDLGIFIDYGIPSHPINTPQKLGEYVKSLGHKHNVLVMLEPQPLMIDFYRWVHYNGDIFDLIFSHYPAMFRWSDSYKKHKYYKLSGETWISENDQKIYNKTKLVTAIWSHKNFGLTGHTLRQEIRNLVSADGSNLIEFNNPKEKIDGLKDYMYEVVIDNEDSFIITEKCNDSFLTGTIPIIWSTEHHPQWEHYDTSGMIFFQNVNEIYDILTSNKLTKEYYDSCMPAIIHNFNQAKKDLHLLDVLYKDGIKDLVENC